MNQQNEFYITLLSNSSMNYFPENKSTCFSTQLQKSIKLSGERIVAIVELQYPCTLLSVNHKHNTMKVIFKTTTGSIKKTIKIEAGKYDSIDDLLLQINSNIHLKEKVEFSINMSTKIVSVNFKTDEIKSLKLSNKLSLQLGFEPNTNLFHENHGSHPANILLGITPQMFIYSDIVEPQLVGDNAAKLLRIAIYRGAPYQKGDGLGSFLGGLFRSALPLLKSSAKIVGREVLRTGINILDDVSDKPSNFKDALQSRIRKAGENLRRKAVDNLRQTAIKKLNVMYGSGLYKRKRVSKGKHTGKAV